MTEDVLANGLSTSRRSSVKRGFSPAVVEPTPEPRVLSRQRQPLFYPSPLPPPPPLSVPNPLQPPPTPHLRLSLPSPSPPRGIGFSICHPQSVSPAKFAPVLKNGLLVCFGTLFFERLIWFCLINFFCFCVCLFVCLFIAEYAPFNGTIRVMIDTPM